MPAPRGKDAQRGGALLSVLWMSAALAAIAFSLASTVRSETDRVSTAADGLRAWYLATGSVERGIQYMMWGPDYRTSSGPRFWEPNLPRMFLPFPSGDAVVEMIPEMSKLNVNTASAGDLLRVVQAITDDPVRSQEIAEAILNWRGTGAASSGLDQYYSLLGPAFQPRRASIQEIEELLFVRGMTPEIFYGNYVADPEGRLYPHGGLRDCLSVWGSTGPFDANTASPALLEAFGMPREAIAPFLARRAEHPFRNLGEAASAGLPPGRFMIGGNLIWTLRATARLRRPDGSPSDVVRSASAVVKLLLDRTRFGLDPVHVLRYYEDAWSQFALAPAGAPSSGAAGAIRP
jgi:general secretion pathway protein K